jgi:hypothetical protein
MSIEDLWDRPPSHLRKFVCGLLNNHSTRHPFMYQWRCTCGVHTSLWYKDTGFATSEVPGERRIAKIKKPVMPDEEKISLGEKECSKKRLKPNRHQRRKILQQRIIDYVYGHDHPCAQDTPVYLREPGEREHNDD